MPTLRLDPFALPSETSQRFRLLMLLATLAAYDMGTLWIYRFGPDDLSMSELAGAGLIAVLLLWGGALTLYTIHQLWIARLHGGVLPSDTDKLLMERVATLAIGKSARLHVSRDIQSSAALAYGLPGMPRILLGGALRLLLRRDPGGFDAIVRHELAHHQNKDIGKVFIARAIFWTLVVLAVANTAAWIVASLVDWDPTTPVLAQLGMRLPEYIAPVAFLAAAYFDYAGLLRVRENYADWRAAQNGSREDLRRLLASFAKSPAGAPIRRLFRLHPTEADRLQALDNPELAGCPNRGAMVAVGMSGAFAICAWTDLLEDLESSGIVDTARWDVGGVNEVISETMSTPVLQAVFLFLFATIVVWGSVVGTVAQKYWAYRYVRQMDVARSAGFVSAILWTGLGFGLGATAWPTRIYGLDFGDGASFAEWMSSIALVGGVGVIMTAVLFLIVWPFVPWTLRIFRRRPPPAWFTS